MSELTAAQKRSDRAGKALKDFCIAEGIPLPPDGKPLPVIGVALSGGGWRSMISSTAFLDSLSEVGLLDAVTYVAGVSGGAWCVMEYMLSEADHNPFHGPNQENPWLFKGRFKPESHSYSGLSEMVSETKVDSAAGLKRDASSIMIRGFLEMTLINDLTIPIVLKNPKLGEGKVERWATFLGESLLRWKQPDGPLDLEIPSPKSDPSLADGTKPILICTAIANRGQEYDWVEFTPFGSRRYMTPGQTIAHPVVENSRLMGNLRWRTGANPEDADEVASEEKIHEQVPLDGSSKLSDEALAAKGFVRLRAPHVMAVCGSAFAFDAKSAAPYLGPFLSSLIPASIRRYTPLGGLTRVPGLGILRDAGMENNVPFPAFLPDYSGRKVDILLVMDASRRAVGYEQLLCAEKSGFYNISDATRLNADNDPMFPEGYRVQVFTPTDRSSGQPIIVYFLGITNRSTRKVKLGPDEVLEDCATIREWFNNQFRGYFRVAMSNFVVGEDRNQPTSGVDPIPVAPEPGTAILEPASEQERRRYEDAPFTSAVRAVCGPAVDWVREVLEREATRDPDIIKNPYRLLVAVESRVSKDTGLPFDELQRCRQVLMKKAVKALLSGSDLPGRNQKPDGEAPFLLDPSVPDENNILNNPVIMGRLLYHVDVAKPKGQDILQRNTGANTVRFANDLFAGYYAALYFGLPLITDSPLPTDGPKEFSMLNGDGVYVWTMMAWMCEGKAEAQRTLLRRMLNAIPAHLAKVANGLKDAASQLVPNSAPKQSRPKLSRLLGLETILQVASITGESTWVYSLLSAIGVPLMRAVEPHIDSAKAIIDELPSMMLERAVILNDKALVGCILNLLPWPPRRSEALNACIEVAKREGNLEMAEVLQSNL